MSGLELEAPRDEAELYTSLGEDVDEFRPAFTGDVLEFDDGRLVVIMQHPCAMRADGVRLVDRVLVTLVREVPKLPKDWLGHYRLMPLPGLEGPDTRFVADFTLIEIMSPEELGSAKRVAILSQTGVNLLLQRWIHHNTRAIVKASTVNDVTIGPYDEADLTADWLRECAEAHLDPDGSTKALEEWLSHRERKRAPTRREALADAQARSGVRADLRRALKDRVNSARGSDPERA